VSTGVWKLYKKVSVRGLLAEGDFRPLPPRNLKRKRSGRCMLHREIDACEAAREFRATELLRMTEGRSGALRSFALLLFGRNEEALEEAKKAGAKLLEAEALLRLGKPEEVLETLEGVEGGEAHAFRAIAFFSMGRSREAQKEAEAALESADLSDVVASSLFPIFNERIDLLEKAVERFPESPLIRLGRAVFLVSLGVADEIPVVKAKTLFELLSIVRANEFFKGPAHALAVLRSAREFRGEVHYALKEAELLLKLGFPEAAERALEAFDRRLVECALKGLPSFYDEVAVLLLDAGRDHDGLCVKK